jgi:hypothetical protein
MLSELHADKTKIVFSNDRNRAKECFENQFDSLGFKIRQECQKVLLENIL